jgi:hypothetical protein
MTRPEIEAVQRRLSLLSEPAVRDEYARAHAKCCLGRGGLPTPAEIQRLLGDLESSLAVATERKAALAALKDASGFMRSAWHLTGPADLWLEYS